MTAHLDELALSALHGRSLLLTQDWPGEDLETLLALAARLRQLDHARHPLTVLPGELAYGLFFDQSTRTRSAWAGAAARLGMHPVLVDGTSTQVTHGETAQETGAMLGMNAHALGIRHDLVLGGGNRFMRDAHEGIEHYLAATSDPRAVPVVNLQCDVDHPTQTLADLLALRDHFGGDIAGRRIAVSWAYSPSYAKPLSVPQGLITLLTRFGAQVTLARPPGYDLLPDTVAEARAGADASGGTFTITDSMDEAFTGADAVYPKSWGPLDIMQERDQADPELEQQALDRNAEHREWICDERRMALTNDALYLHCLPADIGAEVSPAVMEHFRVAVARQANNKLYIIMAVLAGAKLEDLSGRLAALAE